MASRLVELNLQIRSAFRGPLPSAGPAVDSETDDDNIARPVQAGQASFAPPSLTQPPASVKDQQAPQEAAPSLGPLEEEHRPVEVPATGADVEELSNAPEEPIEKAMTFEELTPADRFFLKGLGLDNAMISQDKRFHDRALVRRVLLAGPSELKLSRVVDLYHIVETGDKDTKRRKIRLPQSQAQPVSHGNKPNMLQQMDGGVLLP